SVDGVDVPAIMRDKLDIPPWDAALILSTFMNLGNAGTRFALQQGYGLTDQHLATLARLATTAEWRAIEHIGQRLGDLFPLLDEVHFRHTNRHMVKVEPVAFPVTTADGETIGLTGWYYPAHYDPALHDKSGQNAEMADLKAQMNPIHTAKKTPDGMTRARKVDENGNPVVTYPPLLRFSVLTDHLNKATRWATHAELLFEFRQLTMDPEFKEAFIRKLGAEKYRYLRQWTNRMANPEAGDDDPTNRIIARLRNLSTVAALGWNVRSALRQNESLGIAADIMSNASRKGGVKASGWWWILQGFKEMGVGGFLGGWVNYENRAIRDMHRLSPEARMRGKDVNKDIRDLMGGTDPSKRRWKIAGYEFSRDWFFHFTKAMDQGVAGVVWWGAFHQGMNGAAGFDTKNLTDAQIKEKAIIYADHVLRSQQTPFVTDYTLTQANKGAVSLFTQFMGGVTPYLSHTYGMGQLYGQGKKGKATMVRHLVNVYALPVFVKILLGDMIRRGLTGGDDEEGFGKKMAWGIIDGLVSPLPVIRDFVSVARYGERTATVPALSTPARAFGGTLRAGRQLSEGEVAAAARDMGRALAMFAPFYTPLQQAGDAAEAIGIMEGSD
ncbi:MAG: hypothetical protein LIP77_08505, partial [Planctomycetes bacterium]|nr:hypothetical protein [Planctomycetota bacterium]